MRKPKLLDLFCCAGGATRGYQLAGFEVTGVDKDARPDYIGDHFVQSDALRYAESHASEFDFVHASPPCQLFSTATGDSHMDYPNLIGPMREILDRSGVPYAIENVVPAERKGPMRRDLMLCGEMFGLRVVRHRIFEAGGWTPIQPEHLKHRGRTIGAGRRSRGTYSTDGYYYGVYGEGRDRGSVEEWRMAMGIDWMSDRHDLAEALPPAYTKFIGDQVIGLA